MDGFRWDYFEKTNTPNFDELIDGGSKSEALIPSFPSKTFVGSNQIFRIMSFNNFSYQI